MTIYLSEETFSELRFIGNIGTYHPEGAHPHDRRTLLQGYIEGCEKRSKWDKITPEVVMKRAYAELLKAES